MAARRRKSKGRKALTEKTLAAARKRDEGRYPLELLELRANRLFQEVRRRGGKLPK